MKNLIVWLTIFAALAGGNVSALEDAVVVMNAPGVDAILERALEQARNEETLERAFKRSYYFTRKRVTEFKDSDGDITSKEEKNSRNDPVKQRERDARLAANAAKVVKTSTMSRPERPINADLKGKAFEKSDFPLDGDLLKRYEFTFVKHETLNGRPAYVLDFKPVNGRLPERGIRDKFINKAAGRVWIDEADAAVSRADLYLTKRVDVVGGLVGAVWKFNCTMERERTGEGYWFVRRSQWNLEGRQAWMKRFVTSKEERTELQKCELPPVE